MMSGIKFGEHSKMVAAPSERDRLQKFYRDILGCKVVSKSSTTDSIQVGSDFYIGVIYDAAALPAQDMLRSTWLEIRVDNPDETKRKILQFGITGIDFWDKEHFYFQAPGGQVFRIIGTDEDMSKFER